MPLKNILLFIFILLTGSNALQAQILKQIKDAAKAKAEQKINEKANKEMDKAIDNIGKKNKDSKTKENTSNPEAISITTSSSSSQEDGYIELNPSVHEIFSGGIVWLKGRSFNYKNFNVVDITITGPGGYNKNISALLDKDGNYTVQWYTPDNPGTYTVTALSSDKKAKKEEKIKLNKLGAIENMTDENETVMKKAFDKVKERVEKVKPMISSEQAAQLDKKMEKAKEKKEAADKMFESIKQANQALAKEVKQGANIPPNTNQNLSLLAGKLKQQADDMKNAMDFANHEPYDNTVCEYLQMVNEACAAFSTFVSLYTGTGIVGILKNIALDKAPPMAVEKANGSTIGSIPAPYIGGPKQCAKLYATAAFDAESLLTKMGGASFVGDVVQYASEVLMKNYCGTYSGEMTHTYTFTYYNTYKRKYWEYSGELKAALNLRYPKDHGNGRVIKMKGTLEGNATKFTFFADPKEAVAEELYKVNRYDMVQNIILKNVTPVTVPFVSAQSDKAGFGAVTRSAATPASFYIPIDAEYDLDAKQIKIFVNDALWDFSPMVQNKQLYVVMAALPLFRVATYPIEKAQKTIHGALKEKNIFTVYTDSKGTPRFDGTITRKVNQSDFKIDLSISMKAVKD
jgi:hypothetical protein